MNLKEVEEQYPLVTVIWRDHYSKFESQVTKDTILKWLEKDPIRITSGHLVLETEDYVVVCGTLDEDEDNEEITFTEIFCCLKPDVVEILYRTSPPPAIVSDVRII